MLLCIIVSTLISFSHENFMEDFLRRNKVPIRYPFNTYRNGWNMSYFIENEFLRNNVTKAIKIIKKETCLNFTEVDEKEKLSKDGNAVIFRYANNCTALPGRDPNNKPSYLFLHKECMSSYKVQILLGFMLGRYTEDPICNNNDFLKFLSGNVSQKDDKSLKDKIQNEITKLANDKKIEFNITEYIKNLTGLTIFKLLDGKYYNTIDQDHLSFSDYRLINKYYCQRICRNKLSCKNSGYIDSRNCGRCKCPMFYEGTYCDKLKKSSKSCSKKQHINLTTKKTANIKDSGMKVCFKSIKAPEGKRIRISLQQVNYKKKREGPPYRCLPKQSLEIKSSKDKGPMGRLFCTTLRSYIFDSHSNVVDLRYSGLSKSDGYNMHVKVIG
uniref:Astacin domain-containing protein n=1 Tax=Parastrongyloides trichosuri TaxID=131310 RepID=A0A0N4ZI39_PARTI